jgi:hypothetical protein
LKLSWWLNAIRQSASSPYDIADSETIYWKQKLHPGDSKCMQTAPLTFKWPTIARVKTC